MKYSSKNMEPVQLFNIDHLIKNKDLKNEIESSKSNLKSIKSQNPISKDNSNHQSNKLSLHKNREPENTERVYNDYKISPKHS